MLPNGPSGSNASGHRWLRKALCSYRSWSLTPGQSRIFSVPLSSLLMKGGKLCMGLWLQAELHVKLTKDASWAVQSHRIHNFRYPEFSLAVMCADSWPAGVQGGICDVREVSERLAWSSRDDWGEFQTLQTLWHEHPNAWVLELTVNNKWMKSILRNVLW